MKSHFSFQPERRLCLIAAAILTTASILAEPPTTEAQGGATNVANAKPGRSTFVIPTTSRDGKDPFFPRSDRVYRSGIPKPTGPIAAPVAELTVGGISGTSEKPFAIINNVVFGIGDELDVQSKGKRFRVRCNEINITEGRVRVQVGGEVRELHFQTDK